MCSISCEYLSDHDTRVDTGAAQAQARPGSKLVGCTRQGFVVSPLTLPAYHLAPKDCTYDGVYGFTTGTRITSASDTEIVIDTDSLFGSVSKLVIQFNSDKSLKNMLFGWPPASSNNGGYWTSGGGTDGGYITNSVTQEYQAYIRPSYPYLPYEYSVLPSCISSQPWCEDDSEYIDENKYKCSDWEGYKCTTSGYRPEKLLELQKSCPKSCEEITHVCVGCKNDPTFPCSGWDDYDCAQYIEDNSYAYGEYTPYDIAELQAKCPVSCKEVTPVC